MHDQVVILVNCSHEATIGGERRNDYHNQTLFIPVVLELTARSTILKAANASKEPFRVRRLGHLGFFICLALATLGSKRVICQGDYFVNCYGLYGICPVMGHSAKMLLT
jgi:hypothetical protein